MNKISTVLCCTLVALTAGCVFGDRAGTVKQVSIKLPTQAGASLVAGSSEVEEAVQLIGGVVVPYGLLRDTNAPAKSDVVAYFHNDFAFSYCKVLLRGEGLTVNLFCAGMEQGDKGFKKMSESLKNTLVTRYGTQKIRIVNVN